MIFMRVGDDETQQILALRDQVFDVGENQVDTRQMFFEAKGHTEIDRQPFPVALGADAIDRQVHADFADTAERCEDEFLLLRHFSNSP